METTDKVEVTAQDALTDVESSADKVWDSEKYPAWQKSLAKKYWGDERLNGVDGLSDLVERYINPKGKAPEKYELGLPEGYEDVDGLMRKADLSQDDAKAIADAFAKRFPKVHTHEALKEIYGDDFEKAESDFGKAVKTVIGEDRKTYDAFMKLRDNPAVFEVMRIVGKNLGDSAQLDVGKQEVVAKTSGDPFLDLLLGKK